jgi:hypothetical protein
MRIKRADRNLKIWFKELKKKLNEDDNEEQIPNIE